MKILRLLIAATLLLPLHAATLSGTIKDIRSEKALEFANVAVYTREDESIITGTMSGIDGVFRIFNVPSGIFDIVVTYMGYERESVTDIMITENDRTVDIGTVLLKPATLKMDDIVVEAEKPAVSYRIDKRIVDASQFLTAQGGTAVDILENVPSIDVDIEGNVSLRGSSNFTVMIDGRPSVLEPQDALESIPANTIENIEIMTNASAKFEAEGGAGVINLITKRDQRIGFNGVLNLNAGTNNLGGNILMNFTRPKYNAYISFDYNQRNFRGESYVQRILSYPDTLAEYLSDGSSERSRGGLGIRGGVDWFISKNDVFGISAHIGSNSSNSNSETAYEINFRDPLSPTIYSTEYYTNDQFSTRGGSRYSINADYTHKFNNNNDAEKKGRKPANLNELISGSTRAHQLKVQTSYSNWDMDELSHTFLISESQDTTEGKKTESIGPSNNARLNIEYMLPLGEDQTFEAGLQSRFGWRNNGNDVYYLNTVSGEYEKQDNYSYLITYEQNTYSAFALFSGQYGLLGIQPGLRAEYTYRSILSNSQDSAFVVNRLHIFPTLHLSYELPANIQLMSSYTRRVSRPRGWQFQPFYTWRDAYNIQIGNPELLPEMSDSYDLGIQKRFGKSFVSLDAYYKTTHNKIERIQTVYAEDVILSTYENVGRDYSIGVELMGNLNFYKWWMMNLNTRFYYYQVKGELYGEEFDRDSRNYNVRLRNTFVIRKNTRIQVGLNYRSRSATAQGSSSGGIMTDLSIRQDLFDGQLTATLQVRDLFGTGYHQHEVTTPTYYTYSEFYRQSPMISLNLSLKINNYKDRNRENGLNDEDEFGNSGFDVGEMQ
ncbi:MAG: outer membrane beta-barrel family protein [Candidatus Marinimicrobia bacterium]|nr:outer membrane beta-barrel family protein [Candidatus Neomarinimicrobiota bacterium]MDD5709913.1 outer membrane beta-barrel family protein [Candidatus Neomarinimicrobiota bacterium]MDX9777974.1 outer membrane beta-barrel family protein [bacterium]